MEPSAREAEINAELAELHKRMKVLWAERKSVRAQRKTAEKAAAKLAADIRNAELSSLSEIELSDLALTEYRNSHSLMEVSKALPRGFGWNRTEKLIQERVRNIVTEGMTEHPLWDAAMAYCIDVHEESVRLEAARARYR